MTSNAMDSHPPSSRDENPKPPSHPSLSGSIRTESSSTPIKARKGKKSKSLTPKNNSMEPLTPPRVSANTSKAVTPSPPTSEKSGRGKNRTNKGHGNVRHVQSLTSRKDSSPRPPVQPLSSTPVRSMGTPSQAYAGPTFHASPAPSSLPIPKFFSKNVSQSENIPPEKSTRLKEVVQGTSSEISSVESDDSPTMRNALHASNIQIREASPLDIFFNADRQEKARRELGVATGLENITNGSRQAVPQSSQESPSQDLSPFPSQGPPKRSINNSNVRDFPLELDASQTPKKHTLQNDHPDLPRSNTSPPILTTHAENEEQRKAKTIALKKLLMSPPPQHSSPASSKSSLNSPNTSNLSLSPSPRPTYPFRSTSNSSTPTKTTNKFSDISSRHERQSFSPNSQPTRAFLGSRPSRSRPTSSYLSQEISKDTLAENRELPSTLTPTRSHNEHTPILSKNSCHAQLNGNISPPFNSFQSTTNLKAYSRQDSNYTELMEDTLRKMLKLNVIGQESGTGVRS